MKPILAGLLSVSGTKLTDKEKYLLESANPLGISLFKRNIQSPTQVKALIQNIKEVIGRTDVLIATDQEGGRVCRFTGKNFHHLLAQASIGSLEQNEAIQMSSLQAKLIAFDLKKVGVNLDFAPCIDVAFPDTTPALKTRCFSQDEKLVALCGGVITKTLMQEGIIPCIKHAPGHGRAKSDPHLSLPVLDASLEELEKDFYPFKSLAPIAPFMMTAHIVIPQIDSQPVTQSKKAIDTLIRSYMNFQGLLISDAIDMHALQGSLSEKTKRALSAGCDCICYCLGDSEELEEVIKSCAYLSDSALEKLYQKVLPILNQTEESKDISQIEKSYLTLSLKTKNITEDYDAVEVLNKLKKKN